MSSVSVTPHKQMGTAYPIKVTLVRCTPLTISAMVAGGSKLFDSLVWQLVQRRLAITMSNFFYEIILCAR